MEKRSTVKVVLASLLSALVLSVAAVKAPAATLKPYVLAEDATAPWAEKLAAVSQSLQNAGFEIAGEYRIDEGAAVLVVTSAALKQAASLTDLGGFGAAQRVSVTKVGELVQVAYTNPLWMANVYRMGTDLADVAAALGKALGAVADFGSKDGLSAEKLRSYHYMVMMPYFTDQEVLAEHDSHAAALEKVEQGLAHSKTVRRIARVDLPGKEASLFSVAILDGPGSDATVRQATDTAQLRHTAYLPYEFLVLGKQVLMLHGKFRIAQSFPDLTMGTFMKISSAPSGIEKAIRESVR